MIIKQEELKPETVVKIVSDLLMNNERRDDMKKINKNLRKPFAAVRVVDKISQTLKEKKAKKHLFSFSCPV